MADTTHGEWFELTSAAVGYSSIVMNFGIQTNSIVEEVWFDYFRVEGTGEKPISFTYLISDCARLQRLGCSNVPDNCGVCFAKHWTEDEYGNGACETCASLNRFDTRCVPFRPVVASGAHISSHSPCNHHTVIPGEFCG